MKKGLQDKKKENLPLRSEWIIAISIAFVILIMFAYIDLQSLTVWSTNLLDSIADGSVLNYFKVTALNIHGAPHGGNTGILYYVIPWAIWNIPIWISQRFFGMEIINTPLSLIWSKLFLVAALVITLRYTYKIIMLITKDVKQAKWAIFLSFTYIFTYIGVFYAGQNDVLISMLGTMSIYYLMKNKKPLFYILAGFAISVKYFFFVPYVVLMFFLEKDIIKIIKNIIIGLIPTIIFYLLCFKLPMYAGNNNVSTPITGMLKRMIGASFPILRGQQLSFLLLSIFILVFIAYCIKPKNEEEKNKFIIYFITASLILFFGFGNHEFYRMILLMPFIFIMFSYNKNLFRYNVILETIMSGGYFLTTCISSSYLFSSYYAMKNALLTKILNLNTLNMYSPHSFLNNRLGSFMPMMGTVFASITLASLLIILFINYPRLKLKLDGEEKECERYIIWIRFLIFVPIILGLIYKTL